ncbi:MFS transporter [Streptomyces sp. ME19-01-6]|uniref:MFS transporter n=1 Tax=Streptomyces sp. ME19-01-6 TaxID=3028686 RepID=UPI0029A4E86A|nr:MFS transporter [Streptomyces sp. ME19-01-6]MDX3231885.1 MFS transporter [Streptomyces sp. ME19-01-6]
MAISAIGWLGEGVLYSNDRTLIARHSPPGKVSLGMGVVITGLALGLTIATISAPYMIDLGVDVLGKDDAWRMPFLILGSVTLLFGLVMMPYLRRLGGLLRMGGATLRLGTTSVLFCAAIMAVYLVADGAGMPTWGVAVTETALALVLVGVIFSRRAGDAGAIVRNRDAMLLSVAAIAILWNLWFFSFWSVSIVADAAHSSFTEAALVATFNAGAGIIGFPAGGRLSDWARTRGWGRRPLLVWFTLLQGVLVLLFGFYLQAAGKPSLVVMSVLLFTASLFFNALQPMAHALVAELVEEHQRGAAFGMWNLVGEIGAVISPALGGALFDAYGTWVGAVYIDGALMIAGAVLYVFVREGRAVALAPG